MADIPYQAFLLTLLTWDQEEGHKKSQIKLIKCLVSSRGSQFPSGVKVSSYVVREREKDWGLCSLLYETKKVK